MSIFCNCKKINKRQRLRQKRGSHTGFTIIELLIIMVLIGVMAALSAPYISFGNNPLQDRTNRIASVFKLARAKAVAQTSAYRISQTSVTRLKVEQAKSCFDTTTTGWKEDPSFTVEDRSLREAEDIRGMARTADIQFTNAEVNGTAPTPWTGWTICYDSRGITNTNLVLFLKDMKSNKQKQIEIFSAGGAQVYDYSP